MTFDTYSSSYNENLQKGLQLSGEHADFFSQCRVQFVKAVLRLENSTPQRILEFGTGIGNNVRFLKDVFPRSRIVGVDICESMLEVAKSRLQDDRTFFCTVADFNEYETLDLVFVNGVFHHIPEEGRSFTSFVS